MRICFFSEGSYPHVPGGVSSWMNTMIRSFPEHEFIVYAVGAEKKMRGQYAYEIPENLIEIHEIFLDELQFVDQRKRRRNFHVSQAQHDEIVRLIRGETFDWDIVFSFFEYFKQNDVGEFFLSRTFFNIIKEVYIEDFPFTPFTEFVWTMRSMYLPLFFLLSNKFPEADIYHSVSGGYGGILASYASFLNKKPFILSEHGIYTREREEEIIRADWVKDYYKDIWIKYFYNFSRCAYNHATKVTSLFSTNQELQIGLGCPEHKISIIPNGVVLDRFTEVVDERREGEVNIGAIVRVVPIKDIKTLLQAYKIVKREVPKASLYIMGPIEESEEYYEECLQMAKYLELEDVYFTGRVDVIDYLKFMDFMVLTSISEGQPLAVMEGMAAKKAHVTTNVGACKELLFGIQDHCGPAGIVEYVMDHVGLANSMIHLAKNPKLAEEMGKNGFNRIKKYYQKHDFIEQYRALYLEVVN